MGNGSITRCCKKPEVNIAAQAIHSLEIEKHQTPNGRVRFFPGVRTSDNKHTSPLLTIYTWRESAENVSTQHGNLGSIEGSGGGWQGGSQPSTILTEAGRKDQFKRDIDGNIHTIPVEDIIKIKISTEIKREVEHNKVVRIKTPPPEDSDCCNGVKKCCIRNVCCWCCTETSVAPEHVVTMKEKKTAVRVIVLTVEHLRHSLIHTPSNVRVLSTAKQHDFYEKHLAVETLKFYYLHNNEFEGEGYQKHFNESEALARVVLQLKAMESQYPDQSQLQQILDQQNLHLFGFEPNENMVALEGSGTVTTAVQIKRTKDDD